MYSRKKIQQILHPAYSPDFAPSDFFLFGHIKRKLPECDIPTQQNVESAITHIVDEIGQETLIDVFKT
jgi:hypothetical protein